MNKILPALVLLLTPASLFAQVIPPTYITTDTTWSPSNGVYYIQSGFEVPEGVTLTIEAGTIIKSRATSQSEPTISGNLIANGTAENPIIFTSLWDDTVGGDTDGLGPTPGTPGDWQGLYFKEGSTGRFNHVVVRYSGYGGYGFGNFVGIENDGGDIEIRNSLVSDNWTYFGGQIGTAVRHLSGILLVEDTIFEDNVGGISSSAGTVRIVGNHFKNNIASGVGLYNSHITLTGNDFSGNGYYSSISSPVEFIHEDNTSSDGSNIGFYIAGEFGEISPLHSRDFPLLSFGNSVVIPAGKTLTIEPGTVIKAGNLGVGGFIVYGNLVAEGTREDKIYFTSFKDDTVGGDSNKDGDVTPPAKKDWEAFYFENGSSGTLDNVVIRYAGFNYNGEYMPGVSAAIYQRGADLNISNSFLGHNFQTGIFQDGGTTTITASELTDQGIGIWSRGGNNTISQSSLQGNGSAIFNQSGPTIDARHNWWGSPAGPSGNISGDILYDPWLGQDPFAEPERTPVLIIPGIMGSYLNREDGTEVWMNLSSLVLPGDDSYLNELILPENGVPVVDLTTSDVIRKTGVPLFTRDIFDSMIGVFVEGGYIENETLFVVPYDWRLDIESSAEKLAEAIESVIDQTDSDRVDIVAHSMGGLLVKSYIDNFGSGNINKFIDIATPHIGSPQSFITLNHGDVGIAILNKDRVRVISQNMPSVYQLLPSAEYGVYLHDLIDLDQDGSSGPLSFLQAQEFMKDAGRNSLLIDRAEDFHLDVDDLNPTDYSVETYNIVGCGTPTLDQVFVVDKGDSGELEYNISFTNGDGTVPLKSAEAMDSNEDYYLRLANHSIMPSTVGVRELVSAILTNNVDFDISDYPNLLSSSLGCGMPNGKMVSFHSPIDLHVYDIDENHVGPNENGDIEYNIPGLVYEVIDGNKFAFLPEGTNLIVKGVSTGEGTFTVKMQDIVGETVTETEVYSSIPLTNNTLIEVGEHTVLIDTTGDGSIDEIVYSDDTSVIVVISDLKDKIQSLDITDKLKKNLLKRVENLEKKISKNKNSEIGKIIAFIMKEEIKGKLSDQDAREVINLLEALENTL